MNRDEVGFVDGQLAGNGVPLDTAFRVAALVAAGKVEAAKQLLTGDERALRILNRCLGVLIHD